MKTTILFVVILLLAAGCAPMQAAVENRSSETLAPIVPASTSIPADTAVPTATFYPTYTLPPTWTPEATATRTRLPTFTPRPVTPTRRAVTQVVQVEVEVEGGPLTGAEATLVAQVIENSGAGPVSMEIITPTPKGRTVKETSVNPLTEVHGSGSYLVPSEISPGIWCPLEPDQACHSYVWYPGRTDFRMRSGAGCTEITQVAEVVEFEPVCGPMEFLRLEPYMDDPQDLPLSEAELRAFRGPGEYRVGMHIAAGAWKVKGGRGCEWSVFDLTGNAIVHNFGTGGSVLLDDRAAWVRLMKGCEGMSFLYD